MSSHHNAPKKMLDQPIVLTYAIWVGTLGKPTQIFFSGPCRCVAVVAVLTLFHGKLYSIFVTGFY